MASRAREQNPVVHISPHHGTAPNGVLSTAPKVVVVSRDLLAGGLAADVLKRHLGLDAVISNPSELLGMIGEDRIALIIISADLDSALGSGFDLTNTIYRDHPKIPIVVLLNKMAHASVIRAFRSGARGVFEWGESMSDFMLCVEQVRNGLIWAGREGTDALIEALRSLPSPCETAEDDLSALTARELQVVQQAARGKTNKAIASGLYLSEHTVKNYMFRAFEKLGVSNRVELLFYLASRGHSFGPSERNVEEPAAGL